MRISTPTRVLTRPYHAQYHIMMMNRLFVEHQSTRHLSGLEQASEVSQLFVVLEQRDWKEALAYLRISPIQASTWERGMLPLHAAIAFGAPFDFIKKLVNINPNALQSIDHEGKLPLHYAAIFSNTDQKQKDIMSYMLKLNPESLWVQGSCGRTAVEYSRNDELQKVERIRVRRKLRGIESGYGDREPSLDVLANIDICKKENNQNVQRTAAIEKIQNQINAHRHRESSAVSRSNQKEHETQRKENHEPAHETQAAGDDPSGDECNKTNQDEEYVCNLNCDTKSEEVDQNGRRTVYLNFGLNNDGTNHSYDEESSYSDVDPVEMPDCTTNHNTSMKTILEVIQSSSSLRLKKR